MEDDGTGGISADWERGRESGLVMVIGVDFGLDFGLERERERPRKKLYSFRGGRITRQTRVGKER